MPLIILTAYFSGMKHLYRVRHNCEQSAVVLKCFDGTSSSASTRNAITADAHECSKQTA